MGKDGNPGVNKLTNIMRSMMGEIAERPLLLDFGVIQSDYSLLTNTFPKPIPKNEYNVCRSVTYNPTVPLTQSYNDGTHGHPDAGFAGAHTHNILLPVKMYWIRPGDRVLVAWVQNEAVVIDLVYRGDII